MRGKKVKDVVTQRREKPPMMPGLPQIVQSLAWVRRTGNRWHGTMICLRATRSFRLARKSPSPYQSNQSIDQKPRDGNRNDPYDQRIPPMILNRFGIILVELI